MADFYTILKNAVADMGTTTPGVRRALYDRARAALEAQIAGLETPLPAEMQKAQRDALEHAVARLEADFAAAAETHPPEREPEPERQAAPAPGPEPEEAAREPEPENDAADAGAAADVKAEDVRAEDDKAGRPPAQSVEEPAWRGPPSPSAPPQPVAPAPAAAAPPAEAEAGSKTTPSSMPEAATPPGARPFDAPPQPVAPRPTAPDAASPAPAAGSAPAATARPVPPAPAAASRPTSQVPPRAVPPAGASARPTGGPGSPPPGPRSGLSPRPSAASAFPARPKRRRGRLVAVLAILLVAAGGFAAWQWETARPLLVGMSGKVLTLMGLGRDAPSSEPPPPASSTAPQSESAPAPQQGTEPGTSAPAPANSSGEAQSAPPATAPSAPPVAEATPAVPVPSAAARGADLAKDQDRVVPSGPPSEQAFLIVEQKQEGGQASELRFAGAAQWSLRGTGTDATLNIIVTIPERSASLSVEMKPNTDSALPASHTMVFAYQGAGDPEGNISNIPGLLMRIDGNESSLPLRGAGAMVVPGQFLMGLSGAPADRAHNMSLLRTGQLIVVPVLYESKTRALFVLSKGETGQAVLEAAFAAWGEPAPTVPAAPAAPAQGQ